MNQAELDVVIEKHEKWLRDGHGERADLRGANLRRADLRGANLRRADLRRADLSYADLSYADLRGANLSYADLSGADLRGANLNWINWRDVVGLTVIAAQINTTRKNNQITYIKELEIWTTGCFQGTLEELKTSIENTHKDNEKLKAKYYRVIDFILQEAE
ncbi:pentapeptide repeat-containing protein [Listeria monocytogenes]|nr:pentapeptide repeat-containing protein [Listeria monocytogenes]MCP7415312.1 pentapeptide repeat-containing protein [Listeria monocytogenes]MCP7418408.1 pentapeptide repeat-containing protein [Listeria monocytogenes]MCP7421689.1 pentapeptide repeat-containing protein [Listeria monocytogenes]MCP7424770.1 pentapeptide repeat-containing protein [Listeria monocytogenes]